MHSRIRVQLYEAIGNSWNFSSEFLLQPDKPTFSDTCWQNTDSSSVSVCSWLPQPEPGPQRTQHPHLFWPLHGHMSSRRNLNYIHSTQYPETILFNTPLSILLIKKKKVKTLTSLESLNSSLDGNLFSLNQAGFSPADPVNTAGKFSSMPLTYFHLAPVWCIRSDSPAVTGHLHHCRHDNSERQSMIPYPGHPFQCSLSVQSPWV